MSAFRIASDSSSGGATCNTLQSATSPLSIRKGSSPTALSHHPTRPGAPWFPAVLDDLPSPTHRTVRFILFLKKEGPSMQTLLLDCATWDLAVDAAGNIAVASAPYAVAQNVACAVRVFLGECWYNTALGLPYLTNILGRAQSVALFRADVEQTAQSVDGVARATCVLTAISPQRRLSGVIELTLEDGSQTVVSL
ncbi:hypothetical protein [Acetobacter indonesiensis]|uniref:hypothetical protein n=1 Tax=Acetobacter indonesiensis TaxID=104101 RepID=UPI0020A38B38|nr:hypothetical protein [Acetobacter indonesiensis]MCP1229952.1 hypothetical protein [Acetobacter indonesiensis]